ncbi:MAG: isopentenyl-diphosphate Delta-isomerase [Myxococcota bacterium]|nr:isopentenyl-diphosphate Delta-isomerase [Myxococcota bacterium]
MEEVILVDEQDRALGSAEKHAAHRDGGRLHRAFSIFIFDANGRMLLQHRSRKKYHFGGKWTNACCGHPRPGEQLEAAAHRRLRQELGFDTELRRALGFLYSARDEVSGLTEREFDHVFVGRFDGEPRPDPEEASAVRWVTREELERELREQAEQFTPWFPDAYQRLVAGALVP